MSILTDAVASSLLSLFILALLFVPLERTFTARTQRHLRPELGLDLLYFCAQYLLFLPVLLAFNNLLQHWTMRWSPESLRECVSSAPLYLQAVLVVSLGDLVVYWGHRLSHVCPMLWRFHAVHHSVQRLDWVAAHREHPLDSLYSQFCLNLPGFIMGVDMVSIMPVFVLRGLFATFVHSNVSIRLGPLGLLCGDPTLHRWHHAKSLESRHNFANLAPYWDLIFGTHHRPDHEDYALGLGKERRSSFIHQLLWGA